MILYRIAAASAEGVHAIVIVSIVVIGSGASILFAGYSQIRRRRHAWRLYEAEAERVQAEVSNLLGKGQFSVDDVKYVFNHIDSYPSINGPTRAALKEAMVRKVLLPRLQQFERETRQTKGSGPN